MKFVNWKLLKPDRLEPKVTTGSPAGECDDRTAVQEAIKAFHQGDLPKSIQHFEYILDRGTAKPRIIYTLGLLYCHSGKMDKGLHLIQLASRQRPGVLPLVPANAFTDLLNRLCIQINGNATLRLSLAQALSAEGQRDSARQLHIDIIRSLRSGNDYPSTHTTGLTEDAVRSMISPQPIWQSIDLGGDLFIEGSGKPSSAMAMELLRMHIPDLTGKTVLDVGAWGGFFSFEMERRGAKNVTALDYYSWVTDFEKLHAWAARERSQGRVPDNYNPPAYVFDEEGQPGRRPFDVAHKLLCSRIRAYCGLFETSTDAVGMHDIILYLGVLYHTKDPFGALQKVAAVCRELAIIETLGLVCPGRDDRPFWEFYYDDRINNDKTTWWAPSEQGLHDMLLAAGFSRVEILYGAETLLHLGGDEPNLTRFVAHAYR